MSRSSAVGRSSVFAVLAGVAVLSSCSVEVGYNSSMSPTKLGSAPGEVAMVSYLQASHRYMLNEMGSGTYTLQFSSVPNAGTTTFDGSGPAYSIVETVTVDSMGLPVASGATTLYFLLNPYVPLGAVTSIGTPYGVVITTTPFPATLSVGASGPVNTATLFHDATMTAVDATLEVTYSVMANDTTTLLFCLTSITSAVTPQGTADGLADASESECFTVDAAGNVALSSITVTVNGMPVEFIVG